MYLLLYFQVFGDLNLLLKKANNLRMKGNDEDAKRGEKIMYLNVTGSGLTQECNARNTIVTARKRHVEDNSILFRNENHGRSAPISRYIK